jgi:hypothetical protein
MTNSTTATHEPFVPGMNSGRAKEIYEQLLALADRMGAAYVEAYQKITVGLGDAQDGLAGAGRSDWLHDASSPSASANGGDLVSDPVERARQLSDALLELSTKIGLAYVNAHEQAAIAAADCREALAAGSRSALVRTMASARAELVREIARTCASTAREIVD